MPSTVGAKMASNKYSANAFCPYFVKAEGLEIHCEPFEGMKDITVGFADKKQLNKWFCENCMKHGFPDCPIFTEHDLRY